MKKHIFLKVDDTYDGKNLDTYSASATFTVKKPTPLTLRLFKWLLNVINKNIMRSM